METMEQTEQREHWAALAICAMQPLVVTWLITIALAVGVYALTASSPVLADVTWLDAIHVGSSLWLLSLGATISSGAVRVALMPLLVTAIIAALLYRSAKRGGIVSWADVGVYAAACAASCALAGLFDMPGTFLLGGVLGAGLLGAGAALLAWRSWYAPTWPWWQRVEEGWRYALPVLVGLALAGVALFVAGLVFGHGRVDALYSAYVSGSGGRIGLSLAQLCWLPTLAIWALSLAAGAPVHIGTGSSFSAFTSSTSPLPGIPFFGALPHPGMRLFFLPLLLVAVGALAALWLTRSPKAPGEGDDEDAQLLLAEEETEGGAFHMPAASRELAINAGIGLGLVFLVLAVAGALASGALGSGRLMSVGVNAPLFALLATIESGLGFGGILALRRRKNMSTGSDDGAIAAQLQGRGASVRPAQWSPSHHGAGEDSPSEDAPSTKARRLPFRPKRGTTLAGEMAEPDASAAEPEVLEERPDEEIPTRESPSGGGEEAPDSSDLPRAWLRLVPGEGDESL